MKVINVLELLCENKEEFIIKRYSSKLIDACKKDPSYIVLQNPRYPVNDHQLIKRLFVYLINIDPSKKYLEWIANQYSKQLFMLEDIDTVREDLNDFNKHKNKMEHNDISRYTLSSLRQELSKFAEHKDSGDFHAQIQQAIENNDVIYIGKQNGIDIYHTLTKEGNILLGRGGGHDKINKWCTSRPDHANRFNDYNEKNDIYVFIFDDDNRFQCDVDRSLFRLNNWMNDKDVDIVKTNSDPQYWEQMRHTPFMISIRDKALEQFFSRDEYLTTLPEFVKLCIEYDQNVITHLDLRFTPVSEFEKILPDVLTCLLNIKKDPFFLYGVRDLMEKIDKNYQLNKHYLNRASILDKRFSDRVYNIVENPSISHLESFCKSIVEDSPVLSRLFKVGVEDRTPEPTQQEKEQKDKERQQARDAFITRMAKNKEFKNENR